MRENKSRISVAGLEVEVTRKGIRSIRLRVLPPEGRICVSAPWLMPNAAVADFVLRNEQWIAAQREKLAARPLPAEHDYTSGESLLLWGREYPIELRQGGRGGSLAIEGGRALLTVPEGSDREKREGVVLQWYRERLSEALAVCLPKWERVTGLYSDSWQIKRMKTRWGSCNTRTGKIWINLYLARTPPECLEYVVLHELTHLKISNHGPDFKAAMDAYMPDWRERRRLLNSFAPGME